MEFDVGTRCALKRALWVGNFLGQNLNDLTTTRILSLLHCVTPSCFGDSITKRTWRGVYSN